MKALFIGGTGTISTAVSRQLLEEGHELYLINRGNRNGVLPQGVHSLTADIENEEEVRRLPGDKANSVVFDNAKLKRLVPGFTAQVRYDQGIKKTVDYVLSHKECQREDSKFDAWCDAVVEAVTEAAQRVKRLTAKEQ